MAAIRAIATINQRDAIKRHERVLAQLVGAFLAYLDPLGVVASLPGSSELRDEQLAAAAAQVQAVALAVLAPTKGDGLARTLRALNRSFVALRRLEREVLGLGETAPKAVLPDVGREARAAALAALPTAMLESAYEVIKALDEAGGRSPPRMPPPP